MTAAPHDSSPAEGPPPAAADGPFTPPPRPRAVLVFMSAPILFALILMVAAGGVAILGRLGGEAKGERLRFTLSGACVEAAEPLVRGRIEEIGLADVRLERQAGALVVEATMPGLPDDKTAIPAILARPGKLELRLRGELIGGSSGLEDVAIRLDESGMPYDWVKWKPAEAAVIREAITNNPDGEVIFTLDGEELARRPNGAAMDNDDLRIVTGEGESRERMRKAADRAILLHHGPLPCALEVGAVEIVAPAPSGG